MHSWSHIFTSVWRTNLEPPGWFAIALPADTDTHGLREFMLQAVREFSQLAALNGLPPFAIERFGRFDQQVTSKFHRDGAPDSSLLILGYEPTTVPSKLFIADVTRAAHEAGLERNQYLTQFNPMTKTGEAALATYRQEIPLSPNVPTVVFINNSAHDARISGKPLGLFHRAEILQPDPTARRVINSIGAAPETEIGSRRKTELEQRHFVERTDLD